MFEALLIAQMSYQYLTNANLSVLKNKLYDPNWNNGRTLVELDFNQVNKMLGYIHGCSFLESYQICTWTEGKRSIEITWMLGTDLVIGWRSHGF